MARITWLHLSDWQQEADRDSERDAALKALLEDIRNRVSINPNLNKIDFVVFSGDVAFSGQEQEYQAVKGGLFSPLVSALEWSNWRRLFIVPGNHDLDRKQLGKLRDLHFESEEQIQQWLTDDSRRAMLLQPFAAFQKYINGYNRQEHPAYATTRTFEIDGKQVALLGLNSALMSGRVDDNGSLIVGETQVHDALQEATGADIRIAVLHHPLESLAEFDRLHIQEQLERNCQFILHGHQHTPKITVQSGTVRSNLIIPAGSSYGGQRRRNTGAYNFVHLDTDAAQGTVYLRRWNERRSEWIADLDSYDDGTLQFRFLVSSITDQTTSAAGAQTNRSLGQLGQAEPEVVESLLQALYDINTDVRVQAAQSLGQLGQAAPQVLEALLRALEDNDPSVRAQVAQSLGRLGQAIPEVVEGLLQAFQDDDPTVRAQAARSLGELGQAIPQVVAPLPQTLQSGQPIAEGRQVEEVAQAEGQQVESIREQPKRVEIAVRALADTPSKVDLLGFSVYAEALADFIASENTQKPLSVVIDAAWGMGKTTLMDMVKTRLETRGDKSKEKFFPTIWFNAWKYDQEASLWAALALEILDQIRKQFNVWQRARFWWKLNRKRLDRNLFLHTLLKSLPYIIGLLVLGGIAFAIAWLWQGNAWIETLKKLYITIVGIVGGLAVLSTFGKEAYKRVIKPFDLKIANYVHAPDYKERIGFLGQFEEDFRLVIEAITEEGKWPLVVFIDDLDRCAPPKPVEIIEAINILLDAKHCVFVLGMDAQTVAGSIEAKYKDLQDYLKEVDDPGGLTLGQRFLEKIVQITFHIPRADPEVVKAFIHDNLNVQVDRPSRSRLDEEIEETEQLILAEQRAGKTLDSAAEAVQAARPDIRVELVEKAKQGAFAKSFDDSEDVRLAIGEIAPYLASNPRKIKRFINIFRLQALIANRRGLLSTGTVQLGLLAKWITIVTRWPTMVEAMLTDSNFVKNLREAYVIQEQLRDGLQSDDDFLESAEGKRLRAKLDRYLEDPYKKRLITSSKLRYFLKQMPESDTEALYQYLYLTQTAINAGTIEERPPI